MKIEIGESVGYSYLRHVKKCLVVQTNWKYSPAWERRATDGKIEQLFQDMKTEFGDEVFKKNSGVEQVLKQGEMDVVGVDAQNNIHVLEVAFHEAGLGAKYALTVPKKMLKIYLLLRCCFPAEWKATVGFVSPRTSPQQADMLKSEFKKLQDRYADVEWNLWMNESFSRMLHDTIEASQGNADSSELFLRAGKLMHIADKSVRKMANGDSAERDGGTHPNPRLQPIICNIMKTLLEENPLPSEAIEKLMDLNYCHEQGFAISFPILSQQRFVSGQPRYYAQHYPGGYYLSSEWAQRQHVHNANAFIRYLERLRRKHADSRKRDEKLLQFEKELRDFCD